jgi:hypothetical protein
VDDRMTLAGMAMQGLLGNPHAAGNGALYLGEFAVQCADALIAELHKVPAPPSGPVASPPGSDSPPAVQDVHKGAATPCAMEALAGTAMPKAGEVNPGIGHSPAGENPARPVSSAQDVSQGAASLHAGEDAAARVAPPGDLALPPSATAGENPARPPSRKAKPGTPCGGPSCRDSINMWIHDPRTCPLYKPAKGLHVGPPMGTAIRGKS